MISPWARPGFVDHRTLSFDAYPGFIEDRSLNSQRLDPRTDGWPDARPDVREIAPQRGDLPRGSDLTQTPIHSPILPPRSGSSS
jgi:phospholipase C